MKVNAQISKINKHETYHINEHSHIHLAIQFMNQVTRLSSEK